MLYIHDLEVSVLAERVLEVHVDGAELVEHGGDGDGPLRLAALYHIMSLHHIISYHIILYDIISYNMILYYIVVHYTTLYHSISYHIISYYITL